MIVKLLTERHLEFLSLKGGCRGLSESTHVKMSHCLKSHALAQFNFYFQNKLCISCPMKYQALFSKNGFTKFVVLGGIENS